MAEIVIKVGDQGANPGLFKHGDPLNVREDGFEWGRCLLQGWAAEGRDPALWPGRLSGWVAEGNDAADYPGGFALVKTPGVAASQVEKFLKCHPDGVRQREHSVDCAGLNIQPGDVITVTRAQLLSRFKAKA